MNQYFASPVDQSDNHPLVVPAPREWDALGQSLRAAFCERGGGSNDFAGVMAELDRLT